MGKTDQELTKLRAELLAKVTDSDFTWYDVDLEYKAQSGAAATVTIKVSNPLRKEGYYLPVTARETFDFAKRYGWLPLTRAVADQAHNQASQFSFTWQANLFDFDKYSNDTLAKSYGPVYDTKLVSGSHKLWLLSKFGKKATNYGFYVKADKSNPPNGPRLKGWRVIQTLGGRHNELHWDYSQLLQFMKSDTLTIDGTSYSLPAAIVAGLPAVWDEGGKLQASDLPTPP